MDEKQEEKIRQEAIRMYLQGASPGEICEKLDRSRKWFYEWKKRFESGKAQWYKSLDRAPRTVANKTPAEIEQQVLAIRANLEGTKFAQVGAFAIRWRMQQMGLEPLPTWTIDRILKRHDVVREKKKYQPKNKAYPNVKDLFSESIQQADLVGPRFIKNNGRFYSMNVIDMQTHMAAVNPCRTKRSVDVARGLLHAWKTIGMPDFVQMDNELSFRGSNRHPRSLGLVLRMCLALGIEVVFIPIGEPWRNGVIERFQQVFDKSFFRSQFFTSYAQLKREAGKFERYFNRNHRTSSLKGKTPREYIRQEGIDLCLLDRSVSVKNIDYSLADGYIHLIRFVRSDLKISVFGEKFKMPQAVKYEYVVATISTKDHILQIRLDDQLISSFEYRMPIEYSVY